MTPTFETNFRMLDLIYQVHSPQHLLNIPLNVTARLEENQSPNIPSRSQNDLLNQLAQFQKHHFQTLKYSQSHLKHL